MNKHGLNRDIPEGVKSQVRVLCGFGCVICGAIPYDYDHFRVPFAEATAHEPDDIILLCDHHHRLKNSGYLTNGDIAAARAVHAGDRDAQFKAGIISKGFAVHWPGNVIEANDQSIVVNGTPILTLQAGRDDLEPVLLSGSFCDNFGAEIVRIVDNEYQFKAAAIGDLTCVSSRFTMRTPDNRKALEFILTAQGLVIEQVFHVRGGAFVYGKNGSLRLGNDISCVEFLGCSFTRCETAIVINGPANPPIFAYSERGILARPSAYAHSFRADRCTVGASIG